MRIVALLVIVLGWLITVAGVLVTPSMTARFVICLLGIAISLFGILKLLNAAHLKHAIWKQ